MRAVAREHWLKLNAEKLTDQILEVAGRADRDGIKRILGADDAQAEFLVRRGQEFMRWYRQETRKAGVRTRDWFRSLAAQAASDRFHLTRTAVFQVQGSPSVAAASVFGPDVDLRGEQLNTHRETHGVAEFAINVLPWEGSHWIFLAHHRRFVRLERFVEQLRQLDGDRLAIALSRVLVAYCENLVFSPTFIANLPPEQTRRLEAFFWRTLAHVDLGDDDFHGLSLFAGASGSEVDGAIASHAIAPMGGCDDA